MKDGAAAVNVRALLRRRRPLLQGRRALLGGRCLLLVNSRTLLEQTRRAFIQVGFGSELVGSWRGCGWKWSSSSRGSLRIRPCCSCCAVER